MPETNFTQIKNELIRSDKLTLHEKMVMMVLLSYGSCDKIYLSQARIAKESCMSRNMVHRAIASLKKGKYISTKEQPDRATLEYKLLYRGVTPVRGKVTPDIGMGYTCEVEGVTPVRHTSNKSMSNKSIEIKEQSPADVIPFKKIIDRFNKECAGDFKYKTLDTQKKIRARWGEGFRYNDFEKAIVKSYAKFSSYSDNGGKVKNMRPGIVFDGQMEKRLEWETQAVLDPYGTIPDDILKRKEEFNKRHGNT